MKIRRRDFLKGLASGGALTVIGKPELAFATEQRFPPSAKGILYDATLCIGCQSCMVACKKANNMPEERTAPPGVWDDPIDLSARTLNIIKKYQHGDGEVKDTPEGYSFVKRHCMHCLEPSCVSACPVSAMTKDKVSGIVKYDKDKCIGCRYCQVACPFNIPKFQWDSPTPEIVKCQLCSHLLEKGGISACCEICPTGASLFGPVMRFSMRRREGSIWSLENITIFLYQIFQGQLLLNSNPGWRPSMFQVFTVNMKSAAPRCCTWLASPLKDLVSRTCPMSPTRVSRMVSNTLFIKVWFTRLWFLAVLSIWSTSGVKEMTKNSLAAYPPGFNIKEYNL